TLDLLTEALIGATLCPSSAHDWQISPSRSQPPDKQSFLRRALTGPQLLTQTHYPIMQKITPLSLTEVSHTLDQTSHRDYPRYRTPLRNPRRKPTPARRRA